jgi:hypothetical protein
VHVGAKRNDHRSDGPVLLAERVAIDRYLRWRNYRIREGERNLATFLQWTRDANIEIAAPESKDPRDESGPLPGFGTRGL